MENSYTLNSLFLQRWDNLDSGKAVKRCLLIHHGLGEHSGRYKDTAEAFLEQFDVVYAYDARGHGRSPGLQGHIDSFEEFVNDLKSMIDFISREQQGADLFLLGHSFGGLVSLQFLLRERKPKLKGAVICAPLLGVAMKVPVIKKKMGEFFAGILPKLQLTNEVNPSHLSHDPKIVEEYINDRLVHQKITPGFFKELTASMESAMASHGPIDVPVLFLIPMDDKIVDSKKAIDFFTNLKHRDKRLIEYPEKYHELFNEIGKEKVIEDTLNWIKEMK